MLHPIGYILDFFSNPMSQLVAILASKNQNVNMLKRDFVNLGTIKILFLKWQEFFKEPPLKPLKDFVEIGI